MADDRPTRPPTILGEYGEGYCRHCHMIEPLTASGVIDQHFTGFSAAYNTGDYRCEGSYKVPPKLTPFTSRLARFAAVAPLCTCPVCRPAARTVSLRHEGERG